MDLVKQIIMTTIVGYFFLLHGVNGFHNDPTCGDNELRSPKIVGGETASEAEFPWYVSIKETGRHSCGGFIISSNVVLSAAHCFRDFSKRALESPKTISVTLSVYYTNRRLRSHLEQEVEVKVKRIIRHSNYDAFSESAKYDIALLILEGKIQWNSGIKPVCLPDLNLDSITNASHPGIDYMYRKLSTDSLSLSSQIDFQSGELAVVAGWSSADFMESNIFQKVYLTLYSNEDCRKILKEKNVTMKTDIDSSVICAGSNDVGFDSCSGDSGSALLVKRNKVWVAIGITSSGYGKCGNAAPGLYTRTRSYLDWIHLQTS